MTVKVVFMGSPDFALPTLRELVRHTQVVGVVTQPDRPAGRGKLLTPPPVKILAQKLGLPCIQPVKLREPEAWEQLQAWQPELIVVAAFGQILRQNVLDLPRYGCINVHASLLPRWRGAAPIQAAIIAGDARSGVTIMKMDAGLDTGAILTQREVSIGMEETAGDLAARLAELGSELLVETLDDYLCGKIIPKAQNEEEATYAPKITKEMGNLDFSEPAYLLERKVRAYHPWPLATYEWQGGALKIHRARVAAGAARVGERCVIQGKPAIGCGEGFLILEEVQPAGKKIMSGKAFLLGARAWEVRLRESRP